MMDDTRGESADYRPVPLWSWNDSMEPDECERCMRKLARGGYGGGYLHARLGMSIPYMGTEYKRAIDASVRAASQLNLRAHLYDEDRWPSGWAGGKVPGANPSFRTKALVERSADEAPVSDSRLVARFQEHCYYIIPMALGHPKFNGTCYTDLTNRKAVDSFLHYAYEPLLKLLGKRFGKETPTIFSDEPALTYLYTWPSGGLPWSDEIPGRLPIEAGVNIGKALHALFHDGLNSARVRFIYYRILCDLFVDSFMKPVSAWCHHHGIRWTGHFMYEHSLPLHFSWAVNCHPAYQYFDWPGIDHLGRQVGEVVTALGCRSAVHQFGKSRMMSELYGCSGHHISFADRKWIAEQQIVLGVNHLVPHLVSTTLLGARKRDYPPTFSQHQPWWPLNHLVEDHLTRLCGLMASGVGVTDVLVIHPQESTYVLSENLVPVGQADTWVGRFFHEATKPELRKLDASFKQLCHTLLDAGYVFDFGDESVVAEHSKVEMNGHMAMVRVAHATYRAVVIPPLATIRASTINLVQKFAQTGGVVLVVGQWPRYVDGSCDKNAQALILELQAVSVLTTDISEAVAHLRSECAPTIAIDAMDEHKGRIWRYTRRNENSQRTFIVNLDRLQKRKLKLTWETLPQDMSFLWSTDRDSSAVVDVGSGLHLELEPGASCVIVSGKKPACIPDIASSSAVERRIEASSIPWQVSRLDDNALVIDQAKFRLDGSDWRGPFPTLAIKEWLDETKFCGAIELCYKFDAKFEKKCSDLKILLEGVERQDVQVCCNGQSLKRDDVELERWQDPHWHLIVLSGNLIRPSNIIEVHVSNFEFARPGDNEASRRTGTPLESLILLGDFAVEGDVCDGPQMWEGQIEYHTGRALADWLPRQPMKYFTAPFRLKDAARLENRDAVSQGLPFYSGRLRYTGTIDISDADTHNYILALDQMLAPVGEVHVNGVLAGHYKWPPFELNIGSFLYVGENEISITLYHSLRNLLGPHHNPVGEPVYVNPASFRPEGSDNWLASIEYGKPLPNWSDRYACVSFGLNE